MRGLMLAGIARNRNFDPAPPSSTYKRIPITLSNADGCEATQIAFLHGSCFAPGHDLWSFGQADGGDIRIYSDEAMTTRLPLHLEAFDQGSEILRAFIRITSAMSQNDEIYMRIGSEGGSDTQPAAGEAYGRNAVYQDEQYASNDLLTDLTGAGSMSVAGGSPSTGANGIPFRTFAGVNDTFSRSISHGAVTPVSLRIMGRNITYEDNRPWVCKGLLNDLSLCGLTSPSNGIGLRRAYSDGAELFRTTSGATSGSGSSFIYAGASHNGDAATLPLIVVNGTQYTVEKANARAGTLNSISNTYTVPNNSGGANSCATGEFGVVRVRAAALSAAFLKAEGLNLTTPASFWLAQAAEDL